MKEVSVNMSDQIYQIIQRVQKVNRKAKKYPMIVHQQGIETNSK